jgi:hypothetical protein
MDRGAVQAVRQVFNFIELCHGLPFI